jgi:hypothetical protein
MAAPPVYAADLIEFPPRAGTLTVLEQYDESFALFNRMRKRLGRTELLPPKFDGEGNYIDPREAYPEMQFRKA